MSLRGRHIKWLVAAVVILAAAFTINRLSSTGSDAQLSAPDLNQTNSSGNGFISDKGTYIGFSYPSSFSKIPAETPAGNQLESFSYIKKPSPFWYLNIEINRLPSGKLADDGSFNARRKDPNRYDHTFWQVNGNAVDVFSDKTAIYSKAAYIAQNNLMLSAALTANAPDSGLDQILLNTLKSVYWLKD